MKDQAYLKTGFYSEKTFVNAETGEPMHTEINKTTYLANSNEEFYLMYSSMVLILKGSSDVRMKLFASLLERYSGGAEFSFGSLKRVIAKETRCSVRSLEKAFTSLVTNNIIVNVDYRLYRINPRHVFRGSSKNRNKSLKAILELNCNA